MQTLLLGKGSFTSTIQKIVHAPHTETELQKPDVEEVSIVQKDAPVICCRKECEDWRGNLSKLDVENHCYRYRDVTECRRVILLLTILPKEAS